jgi:uncharacterized protein (TIRG00374 family)
VSRKPRLTYTSRMPWDQIPSSGKFLARGLITAGVICYLLYRVPLTGIYSVLRSARFEFVALGIALSMLARFPAAIRMKAIADAQDLRLSHATILKTLFSTSFYSLLMPGAIAGGAATWMKYVQHGAKSGPAFAAIVVNRLTEIMTVVICGFAYWIVDHKLAGARATLFLACAFAALAVLYVFMLGRAHYFSKLVDMAGRGAWVRNSWVYRRLESFAAHIARMRELPGNTTAIVLAVCIFQDLIGVAAMYSLAHALDLHLGFFAVAWMRAASYTLTLLPVSIAGLGVRDAALIVFSEPYGVTAAAAVAWSSLIFAGLVAAACAGGLIEARALWRRKA